MQTNWKPVIMRRHTLEVGKMRVRAKQPRENGIHRTWRGTSCLIRFINNAANNVLEVLGRCGGRQSNVGRDTFPSFGRVASCVSGPGTSQLAGSFRQSRNILLMISLVRKVKVIMLTNSGTFLREELIYVTFSYVEVMS